MRKCISTVVEFIVDYVDRPHTYLKLKRMGFDIDEISEQTIKVNGYEKYQFTAIANRIL